MKQGTKYKEEETTLNGLKELSKHEIRKTLSDPEQKKETIYKNFLNLKKHVKSLKDLIDKIIDFSGLK